MRHKYAALLALTILVFSMLPVTSQSTSSIFETGDEFFFIGDSYSEFDQYEEMIKTSSTNSSNVLGIDIFDTTSYEIGTRDSEIKIVRDINTPFGFMNTIALSEGNTYISDGERRSNSSFFDEYSNQWYNYSNPVEYLGGQQYYDQGIEPIMSNSTYAVVFPEMNQNTIPAEFFIPFPLDSPNFVYPEAPDAQLAWRTITSGSDTFNINGNDFNIAYTNITAVFSYSYYQEFTLSVPIYDGDWVNINATMNFDSYYYIEYLFDTSSSMLLQFSESREHYTTINGFGSDIMEFTPEGERYIDIEVSKNSYDFFEDTSKLNYISMMYGNDRPVSSGENRLQTDDVLTYSINGRSDATLDDGFQTMKFGGNTEGQATLSVFRHYPGVFEAVFQLNAEFFPDNPVLLDDHEGSNMIFELDILQSPSNDSYEIYPFIEDNIHFDVPNFYGPNDGGMQLDDHDNGGFGIYDTSVPMVDMNEYNEFYEENFNGFNYVVDAHVVEGMYSRSDTITSFSSFYQSEVEIVINAEGSLYMAYDEATGVMVERGQELLVKLEITPSQQPINLDQTQPTTIIELSQNTYMTLHAHPNFYNEQQTEFPEGYNTDTTPTDDGTPDNANNSTPQLELPFAGSFVPIVGSLVFVTIFIRRRE